RALHHPAPHEQSAEDGRDRVVRFAGRRAGSDRGAAERREPRLSRGEAREARPSVGPRLPGHRLDGAEASPPGRPARAGGGGRVSQDIDASSEDVLADWKAAESAADGEEPAGENGESEEGVWGTAETTEPAIADE